MAKVTGIGGVFFKARKGSTGLAAWYQQHLGLSLEDFGGAILQWEQDKAEDKGMTVWHIAESDSEWFSPSSANFMINYRVDDMAGMIERLANRRRLRNIEQLTRAHRHQPGTAP